MQVLALVWGIVSTLAMMIAWIPLLGWLNWLVIPFCIVGLVISIVATAISKRQRGLAIAGIALCSIAILLAAVRLVLGGGII